MANQIIQSIKTIAQSLVDNAGYDKTRGGFIVGVNTVTNTYSVKVDGVTYPIVRAVDDATYHIGDVVKVVIPCNQATQMYISSSVLSDNSLGNKIANATTLAEDAKQLGLDNQVEIKDVFDVANSKNKTFRQDTAPTSGMSSGDVWIDTSDNNTLYVYDGTQWVFSGGGNGQDGLNNATILLYQRGATAPDKPTAELTYTFADASLSPTDASLSLTSALNGWTQAIPQVDGNPCWVIAATASATTATDTIGISEWSTQIKFVEDGVQGKTGATGATGATGNTGTSSYTYIRYSVNANGNPMVTTPTDATLYIGVYTGTSSTAPTSYTSYTWSRYTGQDGATGATGATGKTGATGATGATGETGEVGATGATGLNQATIFLYSRSTSTKPSSSTTYTFASGMLSPIPSGWSRSVPPNNGDPCYVTTAIAIGYGSTTAIASSAWSDPIVLVENGATGATGKTGATGATGATGKTGADGYSPTVTTGTSEDGSTTITVTNKDGSTTTELVDGNAAKTATNFLGYDSENGLLVGNKTSGAWSGYRSQILPTAFNILDAGGNILSSFGANLIELGKNNDSATINLCNGTASFTNKNDDSVNNYKRLGINSANEVGIESENFSVSASYQSGNILNSVDISAFTHLPWNEDPNDPLTSGASSFEILSDSWDTVAKSHNQAYLNLSGSDGSAGIVASYGSTAASITLNGMKSLINIDGDIETTGGLMLSGNISAANLTQKSVTISGLPSDATYTCYYYPVLKICFLRLYYTGKAISATTATTLGTVASGYRPSSIHSFSVYKSQSPTKDMEAQINSSGQIRLYSEVAKVSTDDMYITGFWFV